MKKVTLKFTNWASDWRLDWAELEIKVDGKYLGGGSYGGEAEDNCRSRDYSWVETVLRKLSIELGASVETIELEGLDEE